MVDTLSRYASLNGCNNIDPDDTSNFFRIWSYCFIYGVTIAVLFTVPRYMCGRPGKEDKKFSASDDDLGPIVPSAPAWPDKGTEEKKTGPRVLRGKSALQVDDPQPDLAAAREHFKNSSNTKDDGSWRGLWRTSESDLVQIGGLGIQLYFQLLQGLGLCFCYMSVCTSPIVFFSWQGNFAPDMGQALAKTTIGNLGTIAPPGLLQENRLVIVGCQGMDVKKLTGIFGYLDTLAIIIFMVYILKFLFRTLPREIREADDKTVSIVDFAIEIDRLPAKIQDQSEYEHALKKHILSRLQVIRERWKWRDYGKRSLANWKPRPGGPELAPVGVCEVTLVRDYGKRLGSIKTRAELLRLIDICEYKKDGKSVAKLEAEVAKLSQKLSGLKPEQDLPVVRAYCVLNCHQDLQALLIDYRFSTFWLLRCCQRRDNRFQGRAIRIRQAPEPTDIIPENQDVKLSERCWRIGVMTLLWIVAVGVSASLIFLTGNTAKGQTSVSGQQLGSATCDSGTSRPSATYKCNYQSASLWNTTQAYKFNDDDLGCFCQTRGYTTIVQNAELRDTLCRNWLVEASTAVAMTTFASLVTVIINAAFRFIILTLAEWEKPLSVSALNSSMMWKTFASQFVNTALIIYLINYSGLIFSGDYADYERGWYAIVGGSMAITLVMNSFVGAALYLATEWLNKLSRCVCCRSRIKHQAEFIALYTSAPFDISSRYAQLLTTVFCTLLYSPGVPLVTFMAAVFCFINYWVDKWLLLRASSRPPLYNATMPKIASRMFLWAVPLHCAVAIGMYSHACTFPSNPLGGTLAALSDSAQSASNLEKTDSTGGYVERMTLESTWMLSVVMLLAVVVIALWMTMLVVGGTFGQVWNACCPSWAAKDGLQDVSSTMAWEPWVEETGCKDGQPKTGSQRKEPWPSARAMVESQTPPASYALSRHPEFSGLMKHLRPDALAEASPETLGEPMAMD